MADESVDAWLATQHDERDRYTKAVHKRAERRKADRVRDEAYRLAFARVWDIPKPLDDEAFRQWDERFAELGKILAGHEGLANRLHSANLDGQNVALAGAVKLLQEATKGQTIAAHLRTFSLTPELQRFVEWLPFICDELCPPPPDETTLISTYFEPPGGCSRDDYEATTWLFNKRPVDTPETADDGRTKSDEPTPTSPAVPSNGAKAPTVNARMIDLLGRKPEAKDWSARDFVVALDCSLGSIASAAAWKALMQTRESAKAARQTRSTFKDGRGKRRAK